MLSEKHINEVCNILNVVKETALRTCVEIPEFDAYYFCAPIRGGLQIIINNKGEKLVGTSILSYKEILSAFIAGKRN